MAYQLAQPVVAGGRIFAPFSPSTLVTIDAASGRIVRKKELNDDLLSALAATIIADYYFVRRRLRSTFDEPDAVNWAGVIAILFAVFCAHWLLGPYQPIEVFTSVACVAIVYPALRLTVFRPAAAVSRS